MSILDNAKNFAKATVSTGYDASATSIVLLSGHGARLPAAPFNATWYNATDYADPSDDPNVEIVRVTGKSADTLTVARGQESISASTKNTAAKVYKLIAAPTAKLINIDVSPTYYNAKSFGMVGNGTTDDTAAFQLALNTIASYKGGKIFFPRGKYIIGGALQDTSAGNAQVLIPQNLEANPAITIELIGEVAPTSTWGGQGSPTGDGFSIIKSTLTGAGGTASMLGGASPNPGGNNVTVNVKDLVCECPPNPTLTCLDFSHQYGNRLSNVLIHDGVAADIHPVEPTHDNSYGVKLPPTNHSSRVDCDGLNVTGFRQGVLMGELTSGRIICQACYVGIEVPFAYHPSKLDILGTYGCNYGISCTSAQSVPLRIDLFSIQDDNSQYTPWQIVIKDIYDPINFLRGTFTWSKIQASVGVMHTLTKNGAANFIGTELW